MNKLLVWVVILLAGCASTTPTEVAVKVPTDQEIKARIVRTGERKANGVFYTIEDRIKDTKGDTWRVGFLKIYRESGKVYEFVQIRVDPQYSNYAISTAEPLVLKTGEQATNLINESQERNRVGYYEVTKSFAQIEQNGGATLTLPLAKEQRTLVIDAAVLKGWQKVHGIAGPNDFYPAANY
ncbi:DUF3122 domain-containing protein [Candidatus Cyanaurora vandensis]|uniref:DUF3122 domain-containing protein n=1 Tax=Candidatus Cyanaurora vandensis TaxID=2714958 RepID=UPI00257B1DD3|nr:DUF3122 domain-containing protein [Candidatus Cyanaurora vandensis]